MLGLIELMHLSRNTLLSLEVHPNFGKLGNMSSIIFIGMYSCYENFALVSTGDIKRPRESLEDYKVKISNETVGLETHCCKDQ